MPALFAIVTVSIYFVLWIVFLKESLNRNLDIPWAFLAVTIIGSLLAGHSITFRFGIVVSLDLLLLTMLTFMCLRRNELSNFFVTQKNLWNSFLMGLLIGVIFVLTLNTLPLVGISPQNRVLSWKILLGVVSISLGEELLFRGVVFGYLLKYNFSARGANIIQGLIFLLLHVPNVWLSRNWGILIFVGLFSLSAGYLTWKTKNISGAIIAHAIIDTLTITLTGPPVPM